MHLKNSPVLHLWIIALACFFATTAKGTPVINYVNDPTYVDAYMAGMNLKITAVNEAVDWVIEYGETTAYGQQSAVDTVEANTYNIVTFSITGLKPQTLYHFRCRATGQTTHALTTSADKTFTTTAAVGVSGLQPVTSSSGLLIEADGRRSTRLQTDYPEVGSEPFTYQWLHNGAKVGTNSYQTYLYLNPFKVTDAGKWSYKVSNGMSSATSAEILLTAVTVTRVTEAVVPEGGSFSASVSLTPPNAAATYRWFSLGSGNLTGLGTVIHPSPNKLSISNATPAAEDAYFCEITLGAAKLTVDLGNVSIGLKPLVTPLADATFRVGEPVDIEVETLNEPTSLTVTGLPAGLKFSAATQRITGKPTAASAMTTGASPSPKPSTVSIVGTNRYGKGLPTTFKMTVLPLDPSVIGTFNGIFERESDVKHLGGKLKVVVANTGALSGTATVGTVVYPIAGSVEASAGSADVSVRITGLKSGKNPTLDLDLTLSAGNGGEMTGSVIGSVGSANAMGQRAAWTGMHKFALKGVYNCLFIPADLDNPAMTYPRGPSLGTFTISDLGVASFTGRLADGTAVTGTFTVGSDGQIPLYVSLYTGKGSLLGQLSVDGAGIHSSLSWNKDAAAGGRAYGEGFAPVNMPCSGALWVKPKAASGDALFNLAPGTNGAAMIFHFGDIDGPNEPNVTFNLTSAYAAQIPKATAGNPTPNPYSVSITLNAATGAVSGSFKVTEYDAVIGKKNVTRTGTYYGLCIAGGSGKYVGFFTLPNMPALGPPASNTGITGNPVQTGSVEISAPQ